MERLINMKNDEDLKKIIMEKRTPRRKNATSV